MSAARRCASATRLHAHQVDRPRRGSMNRAAAARTASQRSSSPAAVAESSAGSGSASPASAAASAREPSSPRIANRLDERTALGRAVRQPSRVCVRTWLGAGSTASGCDQTESGTSSSSARTSRGFPAVCRVSAPTTDGCRVRPRDGGERGDGALRQSGQVQAARRRGRPGPRHDGRHREHHEDGQFPLMSHQRRDGLQRLDIGVFGVVDDQQHRFRRPQPVDEVGGRVHRIVAAPRPATSERAPRRAARSPTGWRGPTARHRAGLPARGAARSSRYPGRRRPPPPWRRR